MIHIVLQVRIRPDRREDWLASIRRYTDAVRQEPGNLSFECFESIDTPDFFTLVEGFASKEAGDVHVKTEHFAEFMTWFPGMVAQAPRIVNTELAGDGWTTMAELG